MALNRLTQADTDILALESGNIAGHTIKVAIVGAREGGEPPTVEQIRDRVSRRAARTPRARLLLAHAPLGLNRPAWIDDPSFVPDAHVRAAPGADGPLDRAGLHALIATLFGRRLDRRRPLWQIEIAPLDDGRTAVIMLVHHALCDGQSVLNLVRELVFDLGDEEPPTPAADRDRQAPAPRPGQVALLGLDERAQSVAGAVGTAARTLRSPGSVVSSATTLARLPATLRREVAPLQQPSLFARPAGRRRAVAHVVRPLADLKRAEHAPAKKATVNDVLLAALAGGLRTWTLDRGMTLRTLRSKVPVSMHRPGEAANASANADSSIFVDLPLPEADPIARLTHIATETANRKRHGDADALYALLGDVGRVAPPVERFAGDLLRSPRVFAFAASNVPGPRERLALLGAPVDELFTLAEIADNHALRVAAMSHAGDFAIALVADADAVPDVEALGEAVGAAIDELAALGPDA